MVQGVYQLTDNVLGGFGNLFFVDAFQHQYFCTCCVFEQK